MNYNKILKEGRNYLITKRYVVYYPSFDMIVILVCDLFNEYSIKLLENEYYVDLHNLVQIQEGKNNRIIYLGEL